MLAELAAANAAFSVIKSAVQNGADLTRCAKQVGQLVGAKEDLQKKVNKKKATHRQMTLKSLWHLSVSESKRSN